LNLLLLSSINLCMLNIFLSTFVIYNILYLPCHALLHQGVVYDNIYNCSRLFVSTLHWDILYDLTFSWRIGDRRQVYGWILKNMYLVSLMLWMYKGFFSYSSLSLCFAILIDYGHLSHIDSLAHIELSLIHHVFRAKAATLYTSLVSMVIRPYIFSLNFI
jgi:hypothetical protein